jgi:hypothetical protein
MLPSRFETFFGSTPGSAILPSRPARWCGRRAQRRSRTAPSWGRPKGLSLMAASTMAGAACVGDDCRSVMPTLVIRCAADETLRRRERRSDRIRVRSAHASSIRGEAASGLRPPRQPVQGDHRCSLRAWRKQGRLAFSDKLGTLLAKTFQRLGEPADPHFSSITIEQLLTHRGGLAVMSRR